MKVKSKHIIIEGNINPYNLGVFQQFVDHLRIKNRSENTIYSYQSDLFQFFRFINKYRNDKKYSELETNDIEEYIKFCMIKGNNEDRLKRRCSSISSFLMFLRRKKLINNHPMEFFDRPQKKLDVLEKHFLSKKQVELLKSRLRSIDDIRLETYVLLSLSTAARRNAIRSMKWSDIDFEEREIRAIEKGPREVTLVFSEEVKDKLIELKEYYNSKGISNPYVFLTLSHGLTRQASKNALKIWARKAGELIEISNLTPHSFRRTTANLLKEAGVPLEVISCILNHKDTKVTQVYLKNDFRNIKNLKDKLGI